MEHLTPEQLEDYDNAYVLARHASDAFDARHDAAEYIAQRSKNNFENNLKTVNTSRFTNAEAKFEFFLHAAEVTMPPRAAFEVSAPSEPFASETVWGAMSKEQKLRANDVRTAMAEQFKDYGLTTDSLRVLMSESPEGKNVFTLVHTGNGIDIGDSSKDFDGARSYNSVMDNKNNVLFAVPLGGKTYDARKGMTDVTYRALYEDAKAQGITLPDSEVMAKENDDIWTWTMLTGEKLTADGRVRVRDVAGGEVRRGVCRPGRDSRSLRVRPAVVIE